jgi:adenylate cyclase
LTGTWIWKLTVSIPLFITLVFATLTVENPLVIDEYIEGLLVDYRFKVRNFLSLPPVPDNIVIVAIDEKSLSEYGRWPWNRKLQAELIERVFADRPSAVAVDIFFPESESQEADRALADVLEKHRDRLVVALGFEVEEHKVFVGEIDDVLYDHAIMRIEKQTYLKQIEHAQSFRVLLPPEPIASSATFGHAYSLHDRDGKLRREYPFLKYGDEYFPSFALQAARIYKGIALDKVRIVGGTGVDLGGQLIPTDRHGRLHINYLGKERTFTYKSAADVLSGRIPDEFFIDKIVLIGTSAIATYDLKNTPFSANMPGVEKNATVIANIISGDFIRRSTEYVDLLIVIFAGIITLVIGRQQRALYSVLMYSLLILLVVITSQGVFSKYGIRMNLFFPLMSVITSGTFIITYRYFIEEKRAKDIRNMFSSYVTEKVVNELIKNPEMAKLGGERREVTVLFSDIRGFTSFSEKNAPEEVVAMLNEFLGAMTEVIFEWEGTLDKFIGDAIVAFWGAPLPQENHAELALRCSVHMIKRLEELQQKWACREYWSRGKEDGLYGYRRHCKPGVTDRITHKEI